MSEAVAPRLFAADNDVVWRPDDRTRRRSRIAGLMSEHGFADLQSLHRRSVDDPEWFWGAVVPDLDIAFDRPFSRVLDETGGKEFPRWFVGGKINVAHNCLDRWAEGPEGDRPAVVWEAETGESESVSYRELHADVISFARYLRSVGVGKGDRVGLFVPMIPETAVAFLACARIGAVVVPAFSGYGPDGLAARLQGCDVSVLVTADGFRRKGGVVEMKSVVDEACAHSPSVRTVVVIQHMGSEAPINARDVAWEDALAYGRGSDLDTSCVSLDPNDPLMIVYTSGTTGRPKGVVHSHAGFLTKAGVDFGYSLDVQDDDTVLWITDIGWLMGPLLIVGTLMFGGTAVFYEGIPDFPDPGRVWDVVERHGVTLFGVSPTLVRNLSAAGDHWLQGRSLRSLRAFASTGEPWNADPWQWLFTRVGAGKLPILNYSGGTEIGGGILTCYPTLPLRPCAFSGPALGMDVDVVGDDGSSLRGEVGELVVRNTWPGMAHGFWRDPDRYLEAYWLRFPGTWVHGDLASVDADGYWYVTGRSDDILKIAGKRVGPAEVESAVVAHPAVVEAAVVGVPDDLKGQSLVCFVVLKAGTSGGPDLERDISSSVGERLGKALIPRRIVFVMGLPKTRSGKIMRRAIRGKYLNLPLGDLSSLDDQAPLNSIPEAMKS
jgi:acetyl-CoA synthetase